MKKILNIAEFRCPSLLLLDTNSLSEAANLLEGHIRKVCGIREQDLFKMDLENNIVRVRIITGEYLYEFKTWNNNKSSELGLLSYIYVNMPLSAGGFREGEQVKYKGHMGEGYIEGVLEYKEEGWQISDTNGKKRCLIVMFDRLEKIEND